MSTASPLNTSTPNQAKKMSVVLGIVYSLIVNAVLPFVIYTLLKNYTGVSDFVAVVASGVPPVIDSIVSIIRKGHIDFIAGIVLLSIAISLGLIMLGGSARLYLIRESFFTAAFGIAYLVSLLFPRPLAFYFGRTFATGGVPEKVTWFNGLWQYVNFRHSMRVMTVVWGVGFLLEAVVRTYLVFTLSISQFLIISPFVFYGIIGAIILWTMLYSRQGRKRSQAIRAQSDEKTETTA